MTDPGSKLDQYDLYVYGETGQLMRNCMQPKGKAEETGGRVHIGDL